MKKKTFLIAGIVSGIIGISIIFFQAGYYYCLFTKNDPECGEWKKGIQARTETYQPSCTELKNKGIPKIVKKDNDYYFVHSAENFFYVFGVNIEPGKPVQSYWWGAGNKENLKNCPG